MSIGNDHPHYFPDPVASDALDRGALARDLIASELIIGDRLGHDAFSDDLARAPLAPGAPTADPFDQLLSHHLRAELEPQIGRSVAHFNHTLARDRFRTKRLLLAGAAALAASLALVLFLNASLRSPATTPAPVTGVALDADLAPVELERTFAWRTFDEGTVLTDDNRPMRKVRREVLERVQYYDPRQQALVEMTIPKEEVFLVGLNTY